MESSLVGKPCSYVRPPIAESILVILFGLTAKAALDQFFSGIVLIKDPAEVLAKLAANAGSHLFLFFQLAVLSFTTFRFYLGSLRYHQIRGPYKSLRTLLFDLGSNSLIFTGFYLCALAVRSTLNLYLYVAALHLADFVWFLLIFVLPLSEAQHLMKVLRRFILYDLITLVAFGLIAGTWWLAGWGYGSPYCFQVSCLLVLLVVGLIDFGQNGDFYKGQIVG